MGILLIIEHVNARQTVQIGMQTLIKFLKHVLLSASLELMRIKPCINALENVPTIIGHINLQEIVYNSVHMDILLITRHQNVFKNVLALILMQIH